ncbi:MAG: UDP-3-O-(3-hydroxymyristoyl)glucosamine N-acyltransferase [Synergistaceae bacterium]|jgi:UDP-3-O-[3-hydroxymyristoyl] glucosamine N-acyltransferase|nr:UDP-3-O-(3-hydroxymyristoyl)glucosamine N-acyltransferase [Synergistaceae bacterium]
MKEITLDLIAGLTGGRVIGDGRRIIRGVSSPEDASEDMLCIIWDKAVLERVPRNIAVLSEEGTLCGRDGIELTSPKASLTVILPLFDRRSASHAGVHPSSVLHQDSSLGLKCAIGPGCVISEGAVLGDRVVLQANVFVGKNVSIGDDTFIEASVAIQDFVEVGRRVVVHSGVSVGCDGFGFVPGESGAWKKIPQIGKVVIEDDVEIGPNCTIDRATFGATRIGRGTKLGACVHIAHNCEIGENSMMVGFIALGGSVKTGKNLLVAGMSGIADHVNIGAGVTVAGRTGVTKDVRDGLTVSGFPAREHTEEKRFQASLRRMREYGERLRKLEKLMEKL